MNSETEFDFGLPMLEDNNQINLFLYRPVGNGLIEC